MSYHAKLIKGGKIVIPAELRREYGFNDGDMLVFEREGNGIVVKSQSGMLRDLRAKVKAGLKHPVSVASYLEEKWAEADSE
jgi:AbrB family looped-hinge helix DNA binding protein